MAKSRVIFKARSRDGRAVFYDGAGWTLLQSNARVYPELEASHLKKLISDAHGLKVSVVPVATITKAKKNPAKKRAKPAPENLRQARKAYIDFHGEPVRQVRRATMPAIPKEVWQLGRIVGIAYEAVRDGKRDRYMHKFKSGSAPVLAVSPDGTQLWLVGGHYQVTDRGIEDR